MRVPKARGKTLDNSARIPPPLKAVKPRSLLYQTVQEEIKAYIIQNSLQPGDPLPPETELAQQLNVSRNSVREAVKSLEALGILEARAGTGLFVRGFSFDSILNNLAYGLLFDLKQLTDVLDVRCHLECGMIEDAIQRVTPEQIVQLRAILEEMRQAAEQGSYSAETDRAFHQALWENVDNVVAGKILDIFWMVLRLAQDRLSVPPPVDPVGTYRVHIPIVEALEARNASAMRDAIVFHYEGIKARLRGAQRKM